LTSRPARLILKLDRVLHHVICEWLRTPEPFAFSPTNDSIALPAGEMLIRLDWVCSSIRPPACGNHEYVDWFGMSMELWIQHDGSAR